MTDFPAVCIVFSLYFAFRVPYICRPAPIYIQLSQILLLTFKLYHARHLPSMNCTVVQSSLRPVPVLRNYCFTIIIISPNYRLSIIFTKLSRKTNGTTRFTSCPLPGTKVTICPRSIHRIPNQPYFHVTFTLRFRKVEESGQRTVPCPDLPIAPGYSRGRNVTAGGAREAVAQWAILRSRKRPERVIRNKQCDRSKGAMR